MNRYVLPVGKPTPLDRDGFLAVSTDGMWTQPEMLPCPVADLIGCRASFVLLAAGGVGKTTVLDWLRSREPNSREVNLLGLDKRAIRESLHEAVAAGGAAYVDALDQVALAEPAVFDIVEQVLTQENARRVAWRLSCRPSAWSPRLGSALGRLGFEELRVLPLTRSAAREVVACDVADADQFLDAVVRANLGRLGASPMQLGAAARQWQETGRLPESHAQSIRFEIVRLLSEANPALPPPDVAADRQYRLAGRLGATSVFCGVTAFARTTSPVRGAMPVAELPSIPEPDEPGTPIRPADFAAVLNSALFEAAPHATVAFRHQQYAEYLAADYISQRRITRAQLPALLGTVDRVLPGPIVGVAAWLAALRPDLMQDLVGTNALAFARSGVELAEPARVTVIEGLLAAAAAGDIDPEWSMDLSGLAHPGLDEQLASHLEGIQHSEQLWWLSRLAHAGRCVSLVKMLLRLVLDPTWQAWARRAAIAAISTLGDDEDRRALKPLLRLDEAADPDDEVLAGAIDALYPALMSTAELLDVLRPRRNNHLVGSYLVLLGNLTERVPAHDLPTVLAWAAERSHNRDSERDYGRLIGELTQRGWTEADSPAVRDCLAALLAALAGPPRWGLGTRPNSLPWIENIDVGRRQHLAVAVAARLRDEMWYQLLQLGLLTAADADWLVDELPRLPGTAQQALANCVSPLLDQPTVVQADRILSLPPSHPAYAPTRWWRDPIAVESETADRLRRSNRRGRQDHAEQAAETPQADHLSNALATAKTDLSAWWRVAFWLAGGDTPGEALFSHDLTKRSGWSLLSEDEHLLVFDLGWRYLHEHVLQPSDWRGKETITANKVLPDWSGVYLMTTLVRYQAARISSLAPAVWETWAPAIVGAWNHDAGDDAQLRCDLVDLAPRPGRARIIAAALDHLDALAVNNRHLTPHPLFDHLCIELAPQIADRIVGKQYGDQLTRSLLDLITKHSPITAIETCRRLCEDPASSLSALALQKLAELDPAGAVASLISNGAAPDEIAAIVPRIRFTDLDDAGLEALCRLLLDRFPPADDPPMEPAAFGSDAYETRHIRNRALQLLGERGLVRSLERLAEGRPAIDRLMIGYYRRAARTRAADLAYAHPQPHELLALLGRADARLVRHSGGLLSVIVEQLNEIQHYVRHGGFRDLWNLIEDHEALPKSEDDISDWICHQLQSRLNNGSVVDREIQVERLKPRGVGTRIDLTATSPTAAHPAGAARVIAEAKLINNRSLHTALPDQLVQQYLQPAALHHGIYLVYWVNPEQRPTTWTAKGPTDQTELLSELHQQAGSLNDLEIVPFLLDISRPPA